MTAELVLRQGHLLLVDLSDLMSVQDFVWHVKAHGHTHYAFRRLRHVDGRWGIQFVHTFLTGHRPVDHRNGNGLDNRRDNLRPATTSQNIGNSVSRGGSSRFKGVSYDRSNRSKKVWAANIKVHGRQRRLGRFVHEWQAALAYDTAARDAFGQFACVNFPRFGERCALLPAAEPAPGGAR